MALKKSLNVSGINCEYHRVKQINMAIPGSVIIVLASYAKEDVRNVEKSVGVSLYQGTSDIIVPEGFSLSNLNKENNNPVAEAYSVIKTKAVQEEENSCSKFSGAEDV